MRDRCESATYQSQIADAGPPKTYDMKGDEDLASFETVFSNTMAILEEKVEEKRVLKQQERQERQAKVKRVQTKTQYFTRI